MSLINREALINELNNSHYPGAPYIDACISIAIGKVCDAPTIEPELKWIPCSETVDIPDHEIMACDKYGELMFGYLAYEDEQWLCESDGSMMVDPIAWCEKPKPWKEVNIP